ncbi:DapH/DapD/GlmU-related protein [Azoarcus sp. KH32C]|uniref:DapH/DapD/GlmU-related protein n=1 Tax=Azoarcus sp. KH32C TaxID=748247 RepID=UPI0002386A00|nr:DapH/DapD/GlmU-related protein [Azoarcus sp. KH32C]BAL23238.1 acetyltransferase, CysE/LacA/LpxA/NodL family [Azoarcus sp. KH32C]
MKSEQISLKPSRPSFSIATKLRLALWLLIQKTLFKYSPSKQLRVFLLNLFGAAVEKNCYISSNAVVYMPWNLRMGERSSIDFDTLVYNLDIVNIGSYVSISYGVNLNTGSHDYTDPYFGLVTRQIQIGSGAFVGADVYIGPGVRIGRMAVIGARSVVVKDLPEDAICVGHPCVPIKRRELVRGADA